MAAQIGQQELVTLLLAHGADPDLKTNVCQRVLFISFSFLRVYIDLMTIGEFRLKEYEENPYTRTSVLEQLKIQLLYLFVLEFEPSYSMNVRYDNI